MLTPVLQQPLGWLGSSKQSCHRQCAGGVACGLLTAILQLQLWTAEASPATLGL